MFFSEQSPLASTSTSTPQPSPPAAHEKAPLTSTHTTASPHSSSYHSKDNLNIDKKNIDNKRTTDTARTLLYARIHGVILAGFIWSVWCCDHYRMTPLVTISVLFTGVLYFLWWYRRSSTTASSFSSTPRSFSSKLTDDFVTYPPRAAREEEGGGGTQDLVSSMSPSSISALASITATSVSACSVSSAITISVLAAQDHPNTNNSSMGMSMPPTPTDPPPPYCHNSSTNECGSGGLANSSGRCMQSVQSEAQLQLQLKQTTARSRLQQQQFSRQRLVIHVWSAAASLLSLVSWTIVSRSKFLLLSWLSPILEAEELLLLVPFSSWCWIVVTFVWVLYAMVTFLLLSRGILTRYLDVDVDGAGSGMGTSSEQQLLVEEIIVPTVNKEGEMELIEEQAERTEQESCVKNVDTEDLSEIGQDMDRAQQQIVTKAPSLRILRRSASCRQTVDRSSYKGSNSDAIVKRYRRGPTSTPTKSAHKTWTTSISLLQQVKHEIQFWSFSLWLLAPTIPRSIDQHHHRPQQQPQQHSTNSSDGKEIRRQAPRHPQQYGPVDLKHESLLLTASSSVHREDMDESEYDLVLSEEASGFDHHLASSVVVVATKTEEEEEGQRSFQDRQDGGNQCPIQDDGKSGTRSVLLQTEDHPSFGQLQRYRTPARTGYMSQSMPDLHAIKKTMGPSPVESILARWSRMTLDSERFGSIYQYYLRRRASTLKKERHNNGYDDLDDQDPTTSDDLEDDASSGNDIGNNGDDDDEADPGVTFVIRSSTLPTVRVGLYSADQKRLWTSSGSIHLSPSPESYD